MSMVEMPVGKSEWAGKRCYRFGKAVLVNVVNYFKPASPYGYQASVELVSRKNDLQPQRPVRFAVVTVPQGGLNAWSAAELRELAAVCTEAARQLDEADEWLSGK